MSNLPPAPTFLLIAFLIIQPRCEVSRVVSQFFSCQITSLACLGIFLTWDFFLKLLDLPQNWHKFKKPSSGSQPWSRDFFWTLNIFILKCHCLFPNKSSMPKLLGSICGVKMGYQNQCIYQQNRYRRWSLCFCQHQVNKLAYNLKYSGQNKRHWPKWCHHK